MDRDSLLNLVCDIKNELNDKHFVSIENVEDLIENQIFEVDGIKYETVDNGDNWSIYNLGYYSDIKSLNLDLVKSKTEEKILSIKSASIILDIEVNGGIAKMDCYLSVVCIKENNVHKLEHLVDSMTNVNLDVTLI